MVLVKGRCYNQTLHTMLRRGDPLGFVMCELLGESTICGSTWLSHVSILFWQVAREPSSFYAGSTVKWTYPCGGCPNSLWCAYGVNAAYFLCHGSKLLSSFPKTSTILPSSTSSKTECSNRVWGVSKKPRVCLQANLLLSTCMWNIWSDWMEDLVGRGVGEEVCFPWRVCRVDACSSYFFSWVWANGIGSCFWSKCHAC